MSSATPSASRRSRRRSVTTGPPHRRRTPSVESARLGIEEQLLQSFLDLGDRDEKKLVAALEWFVALGHDHPWATQNRHQRGVAGQIEALDGLTAPRRVVGQRDLDQIRLTLAELHQ